MTREQAGDLLAGAGAADLVTAHEHGLVATFLPIAYDPDAGEHGAVVMHVARNNRQWFDPVVGEAMIIVRGAEHYVSPRWQPSLAEHFQVVPTWNYLTVHAYGELVAHDDPDWTLDAVRRLTALHEPDPAAGYAVDQVPEEYLRRQVRAIVGLELRLTRVEAKAKMSQNKLPADVAGIVAGLRALDRDEQATATATWMQEHSVPAADRRAAVLDEVARAHGPR